MLLKLNLLLKLVQLLSPKLDLFLLRKLGDLLVLLLDLLELLLFL